jgi:hypothetical protein
MVARGGVERSENGTPGLEAKAKHDCYAIRPELSEIIRQSFSWNRTNCKSHDIANQLLRHHSNDDHHQLLKTSWNSISCPFLAL